MSQFLSNIRSLRGTVGVEARKLSEACQSTPFDNGEPWGSGLEFRHDQICALEIEFGEA